MDSTSSVQDQLGVSSVELASAIRKRQTGVESMSMNWLTTWFLAVATARAAPSHPHILLIVSDDLGWSDNNFQTHAHKNLSRHVSIAVTR